jgi:hypothetical protein
MYFNYIHPPIILSLPPSWSTGLPHKLSLFYNYVILFFRCRFCIWEWTNNFWHCVWIHTKEYWSHGCVFTNLGYEKEYSNSTHEFQTNSSLLTSNYQKFLKKLSKIILLNYLQLSVLSKKKASKPQILFKKFFLIEWTPKISAWTVDIGYYKLSQVANEMPGVERSAFSFFTKSSILLFI